MKVLRDLLLTVVVVAIFLAFMAALPILIGISIMGGIFFLVYAYIHDLGLEDSNDSPPEYEEPLD